MLCVTIGSMMEKRWDDSPRSEGTGCPNVLEDEQVWKKISQAEQKSWNSGGKDKSLRPLEEGEDNSGGLQGCHDVMQGEN